MAVVTQRWLGITVHGRPMDAENLDLGALRRLEQVENTSPCSQGGCEPPGEGFLGGWWHHAITWLARWAPGQKKTKPDFWQWFCDTERILSPEEQVEQKCFATAAWRLPHTRLYHPT